ncbi:DMT family transporter [Arabiibacter massiliensis]|uniref:DMT family transporter n=1 Tax=Arabiibacter massiliensis TaxID=1870985 RepID=UPI0009BC547D|nr:multidrug efflux SMR transporter [Arabiibacter massiliensis]
MSPYVLMAVAIVSEVFGSSMMKLSDGFKRKAPTLGILAGYLLAFYLMAQAMQELSLGFVYAAWTGVGIALTAIVGAVFWREGLGAKKALGIAAVIGGVVLLKMGA